MATWRVTNYHLFGTWRKYILFLATWMEGTLMKDLHHILSLFLACKRVHYLEIYITFLSLKKFTLVENMPLESYLLFLSSSIIMWLIFDTHSRPSQVVIILPRIKFLLINSSWSRKMVQATIFLIIRHITKCDRPTISHYVYLVVYLETVNQGFHWCQCGIDQDVNILEMPRPSMMSRWHGWWRTIWWREQCLGTWHEEHLRT